MARPKTPVRLKNAMKTLFSLWHVLASSLLSWQEVATRHPRAVERRAFPQVDTHEISPRNPKIPGAFSHLALPESLGGFAQYRALVASHRD